MTDGLTLRRNDPERTLRREDQGTRRRSAEQLTLRRAKEAETAAPPAAFACLLGGRRVRLQAERQIAAGGEGDVYLCRSDAGAKIVKVLRYDSDLEVLRALAEEQKLLGDSFLVPLDYVGSMREVEGQIADARLYLVSPYYPGGDLADFANMRRVNPSIRYAGEEAAFTGTNAEYARVTCDPAAVNGPEFHRLLSQIHTAMKSLHGAGILGGGLIHRDIRPQNILLDADGSYRLGDFGLVSVLEDGLLMKLTRRFGISHGYSPPEAYAHQRLRQPVSKKYDYFSLGMTLLHVLLGRPRYLLAPEGRKPEAYETSIDDFYETMALSNVQIPGALPERIRLLLRGLLLAPTEHRWGAAEVDAWLAGRDPAVHAPSTEKGSGISVKVNRSTYTGEQEVVEGILRNWDLFRTLTAEGSLEFRWQDPDLAVRRAVEAAVRESRTLDPEIGLRRIVRAIDPESGHVFYGRRYGTDLELGRAMMAATEKQADPFAGYLQTQGLSSRMQDADPEELQAVRMLEAYAAIQPHAAVQHMGRLLAGEALPPLRIPLSSGDELTLTLAGLQEELQRLVTSMLGKYTARIERPLPVLSPVPGIYGSGEQACVVQTDGSVLANPAPLGVKLPVPRRLADLLRYMGGGREIHSVTDICPPLFLHMYQAGWVRRDTDIFAEAGAQRPFRFSLRQLAEQLSLFPDFRSGHALDDAFRGYFAGVRTLLDTTAGLRLPREPNAQQTTRIDTGRQAALGAIRTFEDSRSWEDLAAALDTVPQTVRALAETAGASYGAALRMAAVFPSVFGGTRRELQQDFDALMHEYRRSLDDPAALGRLAAGLELLEQRSAQARQQDLGRYALAEEMELIRSLSREKPEAVDFVVPETTDADVYFAALRRWFAGRKRKARR